MTVPARVKRREVSLAGLCEEAFQAAGDHTPPYNSKEEEAARQYGIAEGVTIAAEVFGIPLQSLLISRRLERIEPGFVISALDPVSINEALSLINMLKEIAAGDTPEGLDLRKALERGEKAVVFRDYTGTGITLPLGGLASIIWRPHESI